MKVGIITVHSVPNFGAVLQAYALARHLRRAGFDTDTIDYRQPALEEMYRVRWRIPPPVKHWLRVRRSDAFVSTRLPLSPFQCRSVDEFLPHAAAYDAFITGSDQVWFTGPVQYYDRMYFLDFPAPGKRKISYAASAGGTTDFGEFAPRVRDALADYHRIGVRDAHTARLVAPLAPHEPTQVVDPVFLDDFADLELERRPLDAPYLLVFGNFSGALDPALRAVIAATGIKRIVSLQYPCAAATHRIAAPSPAQWVRWFRHAEFVVTSYFHGTAFAAKFDRPFLSLPTPGRRIKVATMLDWMGLGERCVLTEPVPSVCADLARRPIDWTAPRAAIAARARDSAEFLQRALA